MRKRQHCAGLNPSRLEIPGKEVDGRTNGDNVREDEQVVERKKEKEGELGNL